MQQHIQQELKKMALARALVITGSSTPLLKAIRLLFSSAFPSLEQEMNATDALTIRPGIKSFLTQLIKTE